MEHRQIVLFRKADESYLTIYDKMAKGFPKIVHLDLMMAEHLRSPKTFHYGEVMEVSEATHMTKNTAKIFMEWLNTVESRKSYQWVAREHKETKSKAWKLFRVKKDGNITSLFINKQKHLPYDEWMDAEKHPTPNFKVRPYWHCTEYPEAPHLSEKGRIWLQVEMDGYVEFDRPDSQGGKWFLAERIRIIPEKNLCI